MVTREAAMTSCDARLASERCASIAARDNSAARDRDGTISWPKYSTPLSLWASNTGWLKCYITLVLRLITVKL